MLACALLTCALRYVHDTYWSDPGDREDEGEWGLEPDYVTRDQLTDYVTRDQLRADLAEREVKLVRWMVGTFIAGIAAGAAFTAVIVRIAL